MVVKNKKLNKRSQYVYPPSVKMSKDWKASAEKQKTSISKFVIEHVLNSLALVYHSSASLWNESRVHQGVEGR